MKANELMIGDYINRKDIGIRRIVIIDGSKNCVETPTSFFGKTSNVISCDDTKPIPLTKDILKLNGFYIRRDAYYLNCGFLGNDWERSGIEIRFYNRVVINIECNYFQHTNRFHLIADYVHELQHALRLCGLDKLADNFKVK